MIISKSLIVSSFFGLEVILDNEPSKDVRGNGTRDKTYFRVSRMESSDAEAPTHHGVGISVARTKTLGTRMLC